MRRVEMKRTKTSLILNRLLAGLGGFIVIILASVPLAFLVCLWVDGGGGGKFMLLALITAISFGGILAWGVWDVVRRWREVAKVQQMVGEMSDEEREEFYSAAEKGDVELTVDNNGGTHSTPLDFG
jgi:hypothetical protein